MARAAPRSSPQGQIVRPVILLSCEQHRCPVSHARAGQPAQRAALRVEYIRSVQRAGGAAVLLPISAEPEAVRAALAAADGLILSGGGDVAPERYGQQRHPSVERVDPARDAAEQAAVEEAMRAGLPILAICRGMQMLNVALGGTLIQDLASHLAAPGADGPAGLDHRRTDHPVRVGAGSILAGMWGEGLTVNSRHHQAIDRLGPWLRATAWAPDGIIEAAESSQGYPLLALQCHPEDLSDDPAFLAPFRWLIARAGTERR